MLTILRNIKKTKIYYTCILKTSTENIKYYIVKINDVLL